MSSNTLSAVFDNRDDAQRAVADLRSAGVSEGAISIVGRPDENSGDSANDGDTGHGMGSIAASVAGGGVVGAVLGVAALAIPGVGPLAAAGAIAASAIPTAAGVGAAVGATTGAIARMLSDHDVDGADAEYFEEHITRGGTFVSVSSGEAGLGAEAMTDILDRNGGHSATRPRLSETPAA